MSLRIPAWLQPAAYHKTINRGRSSSWLFSWGLEFLFGNWELGWGGEVGQGNSLSRAPTESKRSVPNIGNKNVRILTWMLRGLYELACPYEALHAKAKMEILKYILTRESSLSSLGRVPKSDLR